MERLKTWVSASTFAKEMEVVNDEEKKLCYQSIPLHHHNFITFISNNNRNKKIDTSIKLVSSHKFVG